MKIDLSMQENKLNINVSEIEESWILRGYYLYKDGALLKKAVKDNIDANYQFQLESSGIYYVKVYIKNNETLKSENSYSIAYFTDDEKVDFQSFLKSKIHRVDAKKKLEFYSLNKPFQSFAYIYGKNKINKVSVCKNFPKDFKCINLKHGNLITNRKPKELNGNSVIFSGQARYENDILIGNRDIDENVKLDDLKEAYGNFTLFFENEDKVEIATDYFGTQAIYYYNTNEISIVSNEYHMLLIIMTNLDIEMNLDLKRIVANFSLPRGQIFEQRLSSKMDVEGVRKLPIEKYIKIDNNGFSVCNTSMADLLKQQFDIKQYDNYLKQATEEILDNIRIVYQSEKFKNVIVDVTGGVDSRVVFSGVTNMENAYEKTKIHSYDDKRTNDISVAIPLNNLYHYTYDTLPETVYNENYKDGYKILRSLNMGTYYYIDKYIGRTEAEQIIRLMGGGGEAVARPYYSRFLLKEKIGETEDSNEFAKDFFRKRVDKAILGYKGGTEYAEEVLEDEINNTIGNTVLEKFENIYINLRSGIHLNYRANQSESYIEWFPIYSKTTFFLKMKTFHEFKNMKLEMDLIHYFNPIMARIPYEKEINNEEYKAIEKQLSFPEPKFDNINFELDKDKSIWEVAMAEKENNRKIKGESPKEYPREEKYKDLMEMFCYLMNQSEEIKEKIGLPLYHWLKANKDTNADLTVICNKVYSIVDQINIINKVDMK